MKKLLLLPLILCATDTQIESNAALFNENNLILQGDVYLDHPLGKMWADNANLIDYQTKRDTPFSEVDLKKSVRLHFHEGAKLTCDSAHIDMENSWGSVTSDNSVLFTDVINRTPVALKSRKITFAVKEENLDSIHAKEQVKIHFLDNYQITCNEAIYLKVPTPTVHALPDALQTCTVERDFDLIEGEQIAVDLDNRIITIDESLGRLTSKDAPIHFSAKTLAWNDTASTLALEGSVWVSSAEGNLSCDKKVTLEQQTRFGKQEVTHIWACGRTLFTTGKNTLVSPATLHVNRDLCVVDALPAELTTDSVIILSDTAHITYNENADGIQIDSMRFTGHVYLRTKDPDVPLKRALCDTLTYDPSSQKMILSSQAGTNVLYWDEKEDTQMSATEIHIDWPIVKGVGTVHFTFSEEEEGRWFSKYKI